MKSHFTESEDSGNKYTQAHMKQDSNDTHKASHTLTHISYPVLFETVELVRVQIQRNT